jgi:hypothetical protein
MRLDGHAAAVISWPVDSDTVAQGIKISQAKVKYFISHKAMIPSSAEVKAIAETGRQFAI